jgi:hypothetical protein
MASHGRGETVMVGRREVINDTDGGGMGGSTAMFTGFFAFSVYILCRFFAVPFQSKS